MQYFAATFAAVADSPGAQAAAPAPQTTQELVGETNMVHFLSGSQIYNLAQALDVANRYDLVIAHPRTFQGHTNAMHNANPDLTVLVYQKGSTVPDDEGNRFADSWYLRNAQGKKVRSDPWGSYLMDVRKSGYRDAVVQGCYDAIDESGYDGCYFDVMGTGALSIMSTAPVKSQGGDAFTREEWHVLMRDFATHVRNTIPNNIPLMSNSLTAGRRYFDARYPSSELADAMRWSHAEVWQRVAHTGVDNFRDLLTYRWELEMITDASSRGNRLLLTTKLWVNASNAQREQWRKFSYGSFLLATDGSHFWAFTGDKESADTDHALYAFDIGVPLAPYQEGNEGVFTRQFSNGRVISNANDAVRTVSLPAGNFVDYQGNTHSGTIRMGAHTAVVLRNKSNAPAPTPTPTPPPPPGGSGSGLCDGRTPTIVGTSGPDVLLGTAGADVIWGGEGNDRIEGRGGNDVICAGPGNDVVLGGAGNDTIWGDDGKDDLRGGDGADWIRAGKGDDNVHGGSGSDELYGNRDNDILQGGNGNDLLDGGLDQDKCWGGAGTDAGPNCEVRGSASAS